MPDIRLPPLRERRENLPELIEEFLSQGMQNHQRPRREGRGRSARFLMRYRWPGNVRELRNLMENMIVMSRDDVLILDDLLDYLGSELTDTAKQELESSERLQSLERAAVVSALARHHGNRTKAAEVLGISVRTQQRKLKAWGRLPVIHRTNSVMCKRQRCMGQSTNRRRSVPQGFFLCGKMS